MTTPHAALRAAVAADPSRPLVTDVGPAGRTELSVRTYENNVAKAAGLLRDGLDVEPGELVAVLLPVHWQAAVWVGACWAVGAVVTLDAAAGGRVAVATADRLAAVTGADDVLRVSEHPLGLRSGDPLPPGVLEAAVEVRAHGDVFVPYALPADDDPALDTGSATWTAGEVMVRASGLADELGLSAGARLLVTRRGLDALTVLALGAVPLVASGSVVLAPRADPAEVARAERTSAELSEAHMSKCW